MKSRRSDFRRCARLQKDHQCWIASKQQNGQKIPQPVNRFRYTLSEFRFFSLSSLFMQFRLFLAQCDHGSYVHAHKHLHFLANRLLVSTSLALFAHSEVERRGKDCTMCLFRSLLFFPPNQMARICVATYTQVIRRGFHF